MSLSVVPYYNKPTQEGLYRHFRAIAEAVDLPQILYNVPGRTVADMQNDTVLRLAEVPNIVGIKDATAEHRARHRAPAPQAAKTSRVYSGDDAHGARADAARRRRRDLGDRQRRAAADARDVRGGAGRERRAARARSTTGCSALHRHLFFEANPIPVKWAVQQMGLIARRHPPAADAARREVSQTRCARRCARPGSPDAEGLRRHEKVCG